MNLYGKLIISLSVFSGLAALALAFTYETTAPLIRERELQERQKALQEVFFLQKTPEGLSLATKPLAEGVTALYRPGDSGQPVYYAAAGEGIGYNSSVPISVMVGFTGPGDAAANLLKGYVDDRRLPPSGKKDLFIVGLSVIGSEETPGLGEKIKDARPPFTWGQFLGGDRPPENPDKAADFLRQFRGKTASTLSLKKNGGDLDAITASTLTSRGVLAAIRNAEEKLSRALPVPPR